MTTRLTQENLRQWDGIEDNTSDVLTDNNPTNIVENCTYFITGELGRRPGLGGKIGNSGAVCGELNSYVIFIKSNGNIESESQ